MRIPDGRAAGSAAGGILPPPLFSRAARGPRLWQLDRQSIWQDEVFTAAHAACP